MPCVSELDGTLDEVDTICLGDEAHRGLGMGGRDRGSKEGGRGRVY